MPDPVERSTTAPEAAVAALAERIRAAGRLREPLVIHGGGSKDFYGEAARGDLLSTRDLVGSAVHEPTELVVTAPAGMPLVELEARLAEAHQHLAFEPPYFAGGATVGGMVAAGLSGPSRMRAGPLRNHLLGLAMLDGRGELLRFGGKVIKNVAGYDVSRVVAGSLGVLGVIVEVVLKVLPIAERETTLRFDLSPGEALARLQRWRMRPLPLDASAWWNGNLVLRLRGAAAAVREAEVELGGDQVAPEQAEPFWRDLRDQRDPFFFAALDAIEHQDATLWRLALPPTAPHLGLAGDELFEWHGGQRWLATSLPASTVRTAVGAVGGHATMFRSRDKRAGVFMPLAPAERALQQRLKRAFDPHGILNPGRLYADL